MKELVARIKVIQALLREEAQLNMLTATPSANHFKSRTRLIQVKVLLKNYSDREIELARNWDRLKIEHYQSACRRSGNLTQENKPTPKAEDDFWRVVIFLYLLAKNRPMQAFLSLSIGVNWSVLFLAEANEPELPDISKSRDTTGTDYHRRPRLHK
jgi:hypothetical protein